MVLPVIGHFSVAQVAIYSFLWIVAVFAGIVDTMAGGGGLLTLPAMMSAGVPPLLLLGTMRLQAIFAESMATWRFLRQGQMNLGHWWVTILITILGAGCGTLLSVRLPAGHLARLLPFLLTAMFVYMWFQPRLMPTVRRAWSTGWFAVVFGLLIGGYNGFMGPGTGSFWVMAFMIAGACDIRQSTMLAKPLNALGNIASLALFLWFGRVNIALGVWMGVGAMLGAWIGSRLVISRGLTWIRPIFLCVTLVMIVDTAWKAYHGHF